MLAKPPAELSKPLGRPFAAPSSACLPPFAAAAPKLADSMGKSDPACRNASNPYHECMEFCFKWIAEEKERYQRELERSKDEGRAPEERTVHPDCVNATNPFHECGEYCFHRIAEAKERAEGVGEEHHLEQADGGTSGSKVVDKDVDDDSYPQLTGRQKKMFELQLKLNEARKANQSAMVAEKNKLEAPTESRGVSKSKWMEERTKRIGKLLDSNGLDMSKAYMLDTQEMAETKYKKWEKEPAPYGWDVFNQKTLYNAHKKRTKNIVCDMEAYNKEKQEDPEFYRNSSSLQYGKAQKIPEENVDRMVKEIQDREAKRKAFSRRRRFHDEKDIDSINDRNEHFNKKIERAFGKYTLEIKNNLERGTALPD